MKVAQITLDGYFNYGNMLQKYALQHTLKKFVDSTEILYHKDGNQFHHNGFWAHQKPIASIAENPKRYDCFEVIRCAKIKEFEERYLNTRFDIPYFADVADEYDYFVVGSDQVWNPVWIEDLYFLKFAPREKRIAYSVSVATPSIPEKKREQFRAGISGFEHLSVREEGAINIIKELTGQDAMLVADPTLLLTPKEWLEVSRKPAWFKEKYERGYILSYYLRKEPPSELKDLSKKMNLPLVNLLDNKNYWHYTIGPEEFIWLFANASLVYTNSFHGVIFSIIFQRLFVNREIEQDRKGTNMSLRIPSLLKMFGLENRIARAANDFKIENMMEIDYGTCEKVLPAEREKAFRFLANALNALPINQPTRGGKP